MTIGLGLASVGGFASLAAVLITVIKVRGKNGNNGKFVRESVCKERVKTFETRFDALDEKTDAIKETVDKLLDIQLNGKK